VDEFDLIRRFFMRPAAADSADQVVLGIGDDAAVLRLPANTELVVAVDTLVEGRHFPVGTSALAIGYRALAVNLSDMAAMGATPAWVTLALTLPQIEPLWLQQFSDGFYELANTFGVSLVGGDTTRGALTISVQIMGYVPQGAAIRRDGAKCGDLLAVTGTLGDAGAGLALVQRSGGVRLSAADVGPSAAVDELIQRFLYPTPRVAFGQEIRVLASAAMDISDGLVGDLPKLAAASGLSALVEIDRLPLSSALRGHCPLDQARDLALGAGDDYELLVAFPPSNLAALVALAAKLNFQFTVIGELSPGSGVNWTLQGEPYHPVVVGYDHFR